MKSALITGAKGQDAFYLARFLLGIDYKVVLTSRKLSSSFYNNFCNELGDKAIINTNVFIVDNDILKNNEVFDIIEEHKIDEIYNLGGHSSVASSFNTNKSNVIDEPLYVFNKLIDCIKSTKKEIRLFQASSSEMFKDVGDDILDELSEIKASSPYAEGKLKIHEKLKEYRTESGLYLVSGIMFNHESPRRPDEYLFSQISKKVIEISRGLRENLYISNLNTVRDWGYSPEFVEAMWKTLNTDSPEDYIISTGKSYSVEEIINYSFKLFDLDYREYTIEKFNKLREYDVLKKYSNPEKIYNKLSWKAKYDGLDVIGLIINERRKEL